jgi:hypothetical protein
MADRPYAPIPNLNALKGFDPVEPDQVEGVPKQATEVKKSEVLTEVGGTGTAIIGGFLTMQDYNTDFTGVKRIDIFDEMKSDATVRAGVLAIKLPLLSADWYIREPSGNDEKSEVTLFVENQLFKNKGFSWTAFLRQALTMVDNGNAIFEKVYEKLPDGKIGWKRFSPRLSKTIYRWTLQDGKTPGIYQILPTGKTAEIPRWKLLYFINEQEGNNYEGISMLRSAYSHWYYKKLYYKIDAIATEKQGMGIPKITPPTTVTPDDKRKAKEIAQNMRTNEKAYIEVPNGWFVEFMDMKGTSVKDSKEMIAHHDRQIVKAFLAQFLDLGAHSGGSYSLSQDQSRLFLLGLEYVAKIIQEELNKAIEELVRLNFANIKDEDIPTLEYGAIGDVDFDKLSTSLQRLQQSNLVTPTLDLETYILKSMKLPVAEDLSAIREEKDEQARAMFDVPEDEEEDPKEKKPVAKDEEDDEDEPPKKVKADDFMQDIMDFHEQLELAITEKRDDAIRS